MFGKAKAIEKDKRVITGRGPGSGSGKARPDDEAIAILDERLDTPEREGPDVGVVIDPSRSSAPVSWSPHHGMQITEPSQPIFDPSHYTDFERFWTQKLEMFQPDKPEWIVVAHNLETPLQSILGCTYPDPKTGRYQHGLKVRLLLDRGFADLDLPYRISPELTLLDVLQDRGD